MKIEAAVRNARAFLKLLPAVNETLDDVRSKPLGRPPSKTVRPVGRDKAKDGPDLIVWGSSTLTPVLLEYGLADEILLLVFPVLLGTGKRFFSGGAPPRELALVGTKAVSSGVIISTYRPSGPLRTDTFDDPAA